jgi:DNA-binding response OmpR family regulator
MAQILFIDDDTHTLTLMKQIALILGHQAILCPAAKNAFDVAIENDPDLIMIDINMQEMNGFEVVKKLRDHIKTNKTPVIFLSASEPDFETTKAIKVGANGFLPKPLTIRNLENTVTKFII